MWALLLLLQQPVQVDRDLPPYRPEEPLVGALRSLGSDALNNLIAYWAVGFKERHPGLMIEIEGKG